MCVNVWCGVEIGVGVGTGFGVGIGVPVLTRLPPTPKSKGDPKEAPGHGEDMRPHCTAVPHRWVDPTVGCPIQNGIREQPHIRPT